MPVTSPQTERTITITLEEERDALIEEQYQALVNCNTSKIHADELQHAAVILHYAYELSAMGLQTQKKYRTHIIKLYEMAKDICNIDFSSSRLFGFHYMMNEQYEDAIAIFKNISDSYLQQRSSFTQGEYASSQFFKGICHYYQGDNASAKEHFLCAMENDTKGDCTDQQTKIKVLDIIKQLETTAFQNAGYRLTRREDHLQEAKKYLLIKNLAQSKSHIEQACQMQPFSAEIQLFRSNLACLMMKEESLSTYAFIISTRTFAAWLIRANVDTLSKIDSKKIMQEAEVFFKKLTYLRSMQQEEKQALANIFHYTPQAEIEPEFVDVRPICYKIMKLVPDKKDSLYLSDAAISLHKLYKNDLSKIKQAECEEILRLFEKPHAIPKHKTDKKINAHAKNKDYASIIPILKNLHIKFPRSVSIQVELARYYLAWNAVKYHEQAEQCLTHALWLFQTQIDIHCPHLYAYHLQMRMLHLCRGKTEESLAEHRKALSLIASEKRPNADANFITIINEMIELNQNSNNSPELIDIWKNLADKLKKSKILISAVTDSASSGENNHVSETPSTINIDPSVSNDANPSDPNRNSITSSEIDSPESAQIKNLANENSSSTTQETLALHATTDSASSVTNNDASDSNSNSNSIASDEIERLESDSDENSEKDDPSGQPNNSVNNIATDTDPAALAAAQLVAEKIALKKALKAKLKILKKAKKERRKARKKQEKLTQTNPPKSNTPATLIIPPQNGTTENAADHTPTNCTDSKNDSMINPPVVVKEIAAANSAPPTIASEEQPNAPRPPSISSTDNTLTFTALELSQQKQLRAQSRQIRNLNIQNEAFLIQSKEDKDRISLLEEKLANQANLIAQYQNHFTMQLNMAMQFTPPRFAELTPSPALMPQMNGNGMSTPISYANNPRRFQYNSHPHANRISPTTIPQPSLKNGIQFNHK